jgi:hypothetical protein
LRRTSLTHLQAAVRARRCNGAAGGARRIVRNCGPFERTSTIQRSRLRSQSEGSAAGAGRTADQSPASTRGRRSPHWVGRSTSVVAGQLSVAEPRIRPSNRDPKRSAGIIVLRAPVAQWIERRPPEPKVAGSNPVGRASTNVLFASADSPAPVIGSRSASGQRRFRMRWPGGASGLSDPRKRAFPCRVPSGKPAFEFRRRRRRPSGSA